MATAFRKADTTSTEKAHLDLGLLQEPPHPALLPCPINLSCKRCWVYLGSLGCLDHKTWATHAAGGESFPATTVAVFSLLACLRAYPKQLVNGNLGVLRICGERGFPANPVDKHAIRARKIFLDSSLELPRSADLQDAPQPDGSFWAVMDELAPLSAFL